MFELEIQKYLRSGKSLDDLKLDYSINASLSSDKKLVILNYDLIDSPKETEITKECRQLVLEVNSWNLIAKSFTRFLNMGENKNEDCLFFESKNPVTFHSKEDGSIINVFNYNGEWHLATRSTFGNRPLERNNNDLTWRQFFESIVGSPLNEFGLKLDKNRSYIFEMCSKKNIIVRYYKTPIVYLLASYSKEDGTEYSDEELNLVANQISVNRPEKHEIAPNKLDIINYVEAIGDKDQTFEGLVGKVEISKGVYHRLKFKSSKYLILHHSVSQKNMQNVENHLELVLKGEMSEISSHPFFSNFIEEFKATEKKIQFEYEKYISRWEQVKTITSQKEFAMQIQSDIWKFMYFLIKKTNKDPKIIWRQQSDKIKEILLQMWTNKTT